MAGHYPDIDLAMYRKQDPSISRRHLRFYHDLNNVWFVEDLCNHNATFINSYDKPLNHDRYELKNGDRIIVSSSVAFVFKVM
ncbi:MAG: FHA domain-containing protein [Proteobacteria bacterium]|nr:FHA domain-containing protein [Pseudomonadota bacterium]